MTSLDFEVLRAIFFPQISSCFHGGNGLFYTVTNLKTGRVIKRRQSDIVWQEKRAFQTLRIATVKRYVVNGGKTLH